MKAAFLLALAVVAVAAAVLGDNMVEMWRQLGRTSSAGYDDCGAEWGEGGSQMT